MKFVEHKGKMYPAFQGKGNAAQFAIPFAAHVCEGVGYDIGCMKTEWALPGSIPVDVEFDDPWSATNLPKSDVDYIFSSHCLEHIDDWVDVLDYWTQALISGGVLFLYLPHYDQTYWRPWNNRKHKNIFTPEIITDYMADAGYENIFCSERDLNYSFMVMGEKT